MAKTNTAVQTATENKPATTVKSLFQRDDVMAKFNEILGKKSTGFVTSVLQVTSQNSLLAKAEPNTILQAAMVAATLDLPINNNLGFAYIIPYNEKVKGENGQPDTWRTVAQFQMGAKGFVQLALRSGQFKTISYSAIYDGQLVEQNPLTGFVFDFTVKPVGDPIGYAAFFSLINGFEKTLYMSVDELKKHGTSYSQTFKKGYGQWKDNFDAMCKKTVIKLLLSKFAPLSIEMQSSVKMDQGIIRNAETEDISYTDAEPLQIESKETERVMHLIEDCTTIAELENYRTLVTNDTIEGIFNQKYRELGGE